MRYCSNEEQNRRNKDITDRKMAYDFDKIKSFSRLPGRDGRGYDVGVFAQPIVDLNDPDKKHYEILSRFEISFDDPDATERIFHQLEQSNEIINHDIDMLRRAHVVLSFLEKKLPINKLPYLSVNLSPKTLSSQTFTVALQAILRDDPAVGAHLVAEITERFDFDDPARAAHNMKNLHDAHIEISQDDVPEGVCAGLKYETTRQFISTIKMLEGGELILSSIIGKSFDPNDYNRVLEKIETEEMAVSALKNGFHRGQGWHFGRPVEIDVIINQLFIENGVEILS